MKLILSAGHSQTPGRDMGAVGNGFVEGKEAARVRRAIYDQMKAFGVETYRDPDNTVLSESLAIFKQITDADTICIDHHFNAAASKNAKGTEVIVPNNATELELKLAKMIADCISKTLNIPLRGGDKTGRKGVKYESETPHKSLGWMRMPGVNVLIEICFISNPDEMQAYADNFLFLCCNLSNVINDFINQNKCNVTKQPVYIVKSGDSLSKIAKQNATTVSKLKTLNALKSDVIQVGQKLFI